MIIIYDIMFAINTKTASSFTSTTIIIIIIIIIIIMTMTEKVRIQSYRNYYIQFLSRRSYNYYYDMV